MARKGKEIGWGELRFQIDPLVLLSRVAARQKLLLAIIGLVGGIITASIHLLTTQHDSSRASVESVTAPDRSRLALTGAGITALVGLLIAFAREATRQTFMDATEFEQQTGLQVFAVLPNIPKKEA